MMIKRETYMRHIRPLTGNDLIKVLTGIRRSGKSVMLKLIQDEIVAAGVPGDRILNINFEAMRYSDILTAQTLHAYIMEQTGDKEGKVYMFLDEIQEVPTGREMRQFPPDSAILQHIINSRRLNVRI